MVVGKRLNFTKEYMMGPNALRLLAEIVEDNPEATSGGNRSILKLMHHRYWGRAKMGAKDGAKNVYIKQ